MKTILVALNAKYIHTNPAVRLLRRCAEMGGVGGVSFYESTINDGAHTILNGLYALKADVYIFSCYIWNIELIRETASNLRKIMSGCVIAAGGPQVSYDAVGFLAVNQAFDYVLFGEGENILPDFLKALEKGGGMDCRGIAYRRGGGIVANPHALPAELDALPFAYENIECLGGRILYYESMRGCPFSCSYCLSSVEKGVRIRNLQLVYQDLKRFLDGRVRQVKLVDRTFNAVKDHAMRVWSYLIEYDNGVTNFHFEISGELIDADMLELLKKARPGLFQFEIGVQSLNADTLRAIGRQSDFALLSQNVRAIREMGGVHLHLDLIAGLPHEDFSSFQKSFDGVYALRPNQLQLGFLKVLSGSGIEKDAEAYGMKYTDKAPFEVLKTNWLDYSELDILRGISDMLDTYYNRGRFKNIIGYISAFYISPFEFYSEMRAFRLENGYDRQKPSKLGYYDVLYDFMITKGIPVTERARWLCKLDVISFEKPRKIPAWANVDISKNYYAQMIDFLSQDNNINRYLAHYKGYEPKRLLRVVHIEYFPFHPVTGEEGMTAMLFDYASGSEHTLEVLCENGYKLR